MDLYTNSILVLFLGIFLITPLILFKGSSKYAIGLFFVVIFLATIFRPYNLGVDVENYTLYLTDSSSWADEKSKYAFIYYLSFFIPGTWQKLVFLNLLSTLLVTFSFSKIFKRIKLQNKFKGKYIFFIYMAYILALIPALLTVHLKQYIAFGFITLLIEKYKSYTKKIILYEIIISLLILITHPIYFPFLTIYFVSKYYNFEIISLIKNSTQITRFIFLIILSAVIYLLFSKISILYIYVTTLLPGFLSYGIQLSGIEENRSIITTIYPFLIIIPILLFNILSKNKNDNNNKFYGALLIYILFTLPIVFIEYKLNFLYSISRIKSGLYPSVFLLLSYIENFRVSKPNMLLLALSTSSLTLYSLLRFYYSVSS